MATHQNYSFLFELSQFVETFQIHFINAFASQFRENLEHYNDFYIIMKHHIEKQKVSSEKGLKLEMHFEGSREFHAHLNAAKS